MRRQQRILSAALMLTAAAACVMFGFRAAESKTAAALEAMPVTVVVDAGHGGEDGGATSVSGARESDLNLAVARRLGSLLPLCGVGTRMVRTSDCAIYDASARTFHEKKVSDLQNRVKLVNETPNALLVSIHQNLFEDSRYSGAQVFYAPTEESRALAELLQEILIAELDPNNRRRVKPADGVYLLSQIRCPGILLECGFLSNPEEDRLLREPDYQKKLAAAAACGIARWLEEESDTDEV